MSLSSTASNALALSQETSDNFVYGGKSVTFNNCRESAPGLSPALGLCLMKHTGSVIQYISLLKLFFVNQQGISHSWQGTFCEIWAQTLSPLIWEPRHDTGCLLMAVFCQGAVIWEDFLGVSLQARSCTREQLNSEFTTQNSLLQFP